MDYLVELCNAFDYQNKLKPVNSEAKEDIILDEVTQIDFILKRECKKIVPNFGIASVKQIYNETTEEIRGLFEGFMIKEGYKNVSIVENSSWNRYVFRGCRDLFVNIRPVGTNSGLEITIDADCSTSINQ